MKKIIFLLAILFLLPASIAQADNISDCLKKAQDNFTQSVKDSANDAFLQKFDALVWKDDSLKPVRDVFNTAKAKALKKKNDTIAAMNDANGEVVNADALTAADNLYRADLADAMKIYAKARKPILDAYRQKIKDIDNGLQDKIIAIQKKLKEEEIVCNGFVLDCGTVQMVEETGLPGNYEKPKHYDAFVCFGKAVFNNCQPAKISLLEAEGSSGSFLSVKKGGTMGCIGSANIQLELTDSDGTVHATYRGTECNLNLEKMKNYEEGVEKLPGEESNFMSYYWVAERLFTSGLTIPQVEAFNEFPPELQDDPGYKLMKSLNSEIVSAGEMFGFENCKIISN